MQYCVHTMTILSFQLMIFPLQNLFLSFVPFINYSFYSHACSSMFFWVFLFHVLLFGINQYNSYYNISSTWPSIYRYYVYSISGTDNKQIKISASCIKKFCDLVISSYCAFYGVKVLNFNPYIVDISPRAYRPRV